RRTSYEGPWLPAPLETEEPPAFEPVWEGSSTEGRYELLESVSFAFLMALEALTPQQRAVLLLRDVFDYSVEETAEALSLSVPNVKTTHHRARKRMASFEQKRIRDHAAAVERNRQALGSLLQALLARDASAVEGLLAKDVVMLNDGAGEFHAAKVPVLGMPRVSMFLLRIQELRGPPQSAELRLLNGMPALVATWANPREGDSPTAVLRVELDSTGRIREVHSILATRKLTGVRLPQAWTAA
ncbi:MAG: sigma factor-like helix-turn-helix DNA-binding protein, partial [Myxococcaceae bacterium]